LDLSEPELELDPEPDPDGSLLDVLGADEKAISRSRPAPVALPDEGLDVEIPVASNISVSSSVSSSALFSSISARRLLEKGLKGGLFVAKREEASVPLSELALGVDDPPLDSLPLEADLDDRDLVPDTSGAVPPAKRALRGLRCLLPSGREERWCVEMEALLLTILQIEWHFSKRDQVSRFL
jgi:hypothetical protein